MCEEVACVSDRKDGAVRLGAKQVITREVEASERNAWPRTCLDVAMKDLILLSHCSLLFRLGDRQTRRRQGREALPRDRDQGHERRAQAPRG